MLRLYNPRPTTARTMSQWTMGILTVYTVALLALVGLATTNPKIASWVSDATDAEHAASQPSAVEEKTQIAQPVHPMLSARINSLEAAARQPDRSYR
jgi:hypothetical protein